MTLFPKSDFWGLEGLAHLASGGQPPLLKSQQAAFEAFARDKAGGMAGYERHWEVCDQVKARLAAMTHLTPGDIALIGTASEGIARIVSSIDWRPGDNVVVSAIDYSSGRYTLAGLQTRGVEPRLVAPKGWFIDIDELIAACDARTRLVYVSQVNSLTGQQIDMARLSQGLAGRGILLLSDATHAMGVVPVDGRHCDFLVASTYKFLLAPHSGILAWNRARWPDFEPLGVAWNSATPGEVAGGYRLAPDARRAEFGNSGHLAVYLLRTALDYLTQVPEDALSRHIDSLATQLHDGLTGLGHKIMTPHAPADRGPNICFEHAQPRPFADAAAKEGILVWGENGRVRASLHGFVTAEDVARLLAFAAAHKT